MTERKVWVRNATGEYVCLLCEERSKRLRSAVMEQVRAFRTGYAETLREHFREHSDNPKRLHGDLLPVTRAQLDELDAAEIDELEQIAITNMSYDDGCEELAGAFLGDYPKATAYDRARLARVIQEAVEQWIEGEAFSGKADTHG